MHAPGRAVAPVPKGRALMESPQFLFIAWALGVLLGLFRSFIIGGR